MKKKLFLSSGLVLASLVGFVGCGGLTSSEQQKVYKEEIKEVNNKTTNKFEEEYKKDKFAFTFNEGLSAALKGSLTTYSITNNDVTTTTTPKTITLNESLSQDATAILSFDTAYYRSLTSTSKKETNDTYAYAEANSKLTLSEDFQKLVDSEIEGADVKAQAVLKDGAGTAYANINGEENGSSFTYKEYDTYLAAGIGSIDKALTKETTAERIESLRTDLKAYAVILELSEDEIKYIDIICDVLKSASEQTTKEELTADDIYEIFASIYGQKVDEATKTKIKTMIEKVLTIIKDAEIITITKETSKGVTNYKYALNYANLITAVKASVEACKQYAIEQEPTQTQTITKVFDQITTIIDTYLANINVEQALTFTVKDNLLTGVKEEFKVADFKAENLPFMTEYDNGNYIRTYASINISELSFTASYSFDFDAKAKADLPAVPTPTVKAIA